MNSKSKTVTVLATLGALIFVAMTMDRAITPYLPLSAAFLTLTVTFTFALMRPRLWSCLAAALIFGVSSCLTAIMFGKESVINPLISVLPRFLLGFVIFGVYKCARLLTRGMKNRAAAEAISLSSAAALTAASNTVLFLSAMYLFGNGNTIQSLFTITVLVNALPEFIISAALVPVVTMAVRKGLHIRPDDPPKPAAKPITQPAPATAELETAAPAEPDHTEQQTEPATHETATAEPVQSGQAAQEETKPQ